MICVSCTYGDNRIGPASEARGPKGGGRQQRLFVGVHRPSTGTYTSPDATTYSLEATNGSVVLIVGTDGSVNLSVDTTGGTDGTVVITSGGGYIAAEGGETC